MPKTFRQVPKRFRCMPERRQAGSLRQLPCLWDKRRRRCGGRRPAARKERGQTRAVLKFYSAVRGSRALYPPGGTPRLYGRQDARRYAKTAESTSGSGAWLCEWRCANFNMNCHGLERLTSLFSGLRSSNPAFDAQLRNSFFQK
jgi:hypothetical protein